MVWSLLLDLVPKRRQALFPRSHENEFPKSLSQTNLQSPGTEYDKLWRFWLPKKKKKEKERKLRSVVGEKSLPSKLQPFFIFIPYPCQIPNHMHLHLLSSQTTITHLFLLTKNIISSHESWPCSSSVFGTVCFCSSFNTNPNYLLPLFILAFMVLSGLGPRRHHLQTLHLRRTWTGFLRKKLLQLRPFPLELFFTVTTHHNGDFCKLALTVHTLDTPIPSTSPGIPQLSPTSTIYFFHCRLFRRWWILSIPANSTLLDFH